MGCVTLPRRVPGVAGACVLALGLGVALLDAQQPKPRANHLTPLPLTQLEGRALAADLDNRTSVWTFAQPVPIRDLLLLLVRDTSLSVVPDADVSGSFVGELKNVTVRQALDLILPQL